MGKRRAHFTDYVSRQICEKIALGKSLKVALSEITLAPPMPRFWRWLDEYPEFREKYERARQMAADIHADTILDFATEVVANPTKASAIRVATDILKWQAEIRDPKKYGPKAVVRVREEKMSPDDLRREIAKLELELGVKAVPGMNTAPNFVRKPDIVIDAEIMAKSEVDPPSAEQPSNIDSHNEEHLKLLLKLGASERLQ